MPPSGPVLGWRHKTPSKRRKEEKKKRRKRREVEGGAKERSGTREGLAWSGIGGGQASEDDALRRNPCVISCVCPKPPAPRPRHLVPLLGELDGNLQFDEGSDETPRLHLIAKGLSGVGFEATKPPWRLMSRAAGEPRPLLRPRATSQMQVIAPPSGLARLYICTFGCSRCCAYARARGRVECFRSKGILTPVCSAP